ncbi:Peptidase family S58 [Posidoniimonas polymericola]|uniref:Peptidase family S58 n=1 Tax=Posidoniimonas polymericola TaxID=2528002 RepID=A0A5C5YRE4_9BACT|nr:P1 family peptidase [Posidoniimonas polymericola]TWT77455.1 Peptidase family S58 [Posidoniimonas polymericola]
MRALLFFLLLVIPANAEPRARCRELGIAPGDYPPGRHNAITDVAGVTVGHSTLIEGDSIRTGATAIVPHQGDVFRRKPPAAIAVGNGFGKLVGSTQVDELGQLETPILLTNTLNVWEAAATLVDRTLAAPGNESVRSVNPVVGETNDGWLNDIRTRPLTQKHFRAALDDAYGGPVEEGAVGAGVGTTTMGFKGGVGTSSRVLPNEAGGFTLGVLVQTNYGGRLTIGGAVIDPPRTQANTGGPPVEYGSCMIVVATDAPLSARQLKRVARRALVGMARTGANFSHGSGDYVIAFSTAETNRIPYEGDAVTRAVVVIDEARLTPLFEAAADATQEAIYNALLQAKTVRGVNGHTAEALTPDAVRRAISPPPNG